MGRRWLIANALWLQAGWWMCVYGAHHPWLLMLVPLGLALHLAGCPDRLGETYAVLRCTLAGCVLDSLLGALGVFRFDSWPLPLWLGLLWLVLACGLRHSLAWLGQPIWRAVLCGAVGGPLAYLGGARLADVELPLGAALTCPLLAVVWGLALPLLLRLAAWR
jgi:hypothetical protein